jgi:uncharacterized protein (TIGR00730 family)
MPYGQLPFRRSSRLEMVMPALILPTQRQPRPLARFCPSTGSGWSTAAVTRALEAREIAHRGLTSLEIVQTMHERKAAMAGKADGFIMLPGGFGTPDEFFEVVTWTQLGIHAKPCGVLDVGGFFAPLRELLEAATRRECSSG